MVRVPNSMLRSLRHRRLRRLIDRLVDAELDEQETAAVLDHLLRCPDCLGATESTWQIKDALARLQSVSS